MFTNKRGGGGQNKKNKINTTKTCNNVVLTEHIFSYEQIINSLQSAVLNVIYYQIANTNNVTLKVLKERFGLCTKYEEICHRVMYFAETYAIFFKINTFQTIL